MGDEREWEWFDAQLAHPDGRATGGEPCVVCDEPVPLNAHWKQRDRHVCSSRCNEKLRRRLRRRIRSGKVKPPVAVAPEREPGGVVFRTVPVTEPGGVPFEFLGWGPLIGDVVDRYGSITAYLPAEPVVVGDDTVPAALAYHLNTGAAAVIPLDASGHLGRLWLGVTDGAGQRVVSVAKSHIDVAGTDLALRAHQALDPEVRFGDGWLEVLEALSTVIGDPASAAVLDTLLDERDGPLAVGDACQLVEVAAAATTR